MSNEAKCPYAVDARTNTIAGHISYHLYQISIGDSHVK